MVEHSWLVGDLKGGQFRERLWASGSHNSDSLQILLRFRLQHRLQYHSGRRAVQFHLPQRDRIQHGRQLHGNFLRICCSGVHLEREHWLGILHVAGDLEYASHCFHFGSYSLGN
ncbi:hypothetical protein D3C75_644510 [compost metagenome]